MDLKALAVRTVKLGMGLAGTAKSKVTLHLGKGGAYDFDADAIVPAGGADVPVEALKFKTKEQQKADLTERVTAFFIDGADAPQGIREADTITETDPDPPVVWNIYAVDPVLESVAWIVSARR